MTEVVIAKVKFISQFHGYFLFGLGKHFIFEISHPFAVILMRASDVVNYSFSHMNENKNMLRLFL